MSTFIPIPAYPPFTLRSSLIDKDPVIWVHLLEAYITLFHHLVSSGENFTHLTVKSKQQLYEFFKKYLHETYDEENKIFSLGAINTDITKNEAFLKQIVFYTIKLYSILKLNLVNELIWDFIGIYVSNNASTVRGLVDGSFKSKYNDNKKSGNISSIGSVQNHLQKKLLNGDFSGKDKTILLNLLGQCLSSKTTINLSNSTKKTEVSNKKSIEFAEKFVNKEWIEILEKAFANGRGIRAELAKELMVILLISLPSDRIVRLVKNMGITKPSDMTKSVLFCSIITSEEFGELIAGIDEKLSFLTVGLVQGSQVSVSQENIDNLVSIFPDLGIERARIVLNDNNDDVEHVINMLLENPSLIDKIEPPKPTPPPTKATSPANTNSDRFSKEKYLVIKLKKSQNIKVNSLDEKLKQATIDLAMNSLAEQEEEDVEIYGQFEKFFEEKMNGKTLGPPKSNEEYLYAVYQNEGMGPFLPESRNKTLRGHLKEHTGWSDNLIEDWGRMLTLQKDLKALKESKTNDKKETKTGERDNSKSTQKYNDRKKASKANHNRKSQHGKKSRLEMAGMRD